MSELAPKPPSKESANDRFQTWDEFGIKAFELIASVKDRDHERGHLKKSSVKQRAPRSGDDHKYTFREIEDGFSIRVTNEEKPRSRMNPKTGKYELTKNRVEVSELLGVGEFDSSYFDYVVKVTKEGVGNLAEYEARLLFDAVPIGKESQAPQRIAALEGLTLPSQGGEHNFAEKLYEILQKAINR